VRLMRALLGFSMVLGAAGWLMADTIPDPIIKLSIPGGHSTDLCIPASGQATCSNTFSIDENGFATIDVKNVNQFAAIEMDWLFPTQNLDQAFTVSSTDFSDVTVTRHFSECATFPCFGGTLEVDYTLNGDPNTNPAFLFVPGIPCDSEVCPTADGFTPGGVVTLTTTYSDVTDPQPDCNGINACDGLQPQEHAELTLTSDVPEPGSFVLLLGAAGLIAVKSKFHRRT
jgi:hypothetical protein